MAAGTITVIAATQDRLVYDYVGGGQTDTLTAAQVIAACAAGPLKTFLTRVDSGIVGSIPSWADFRMKRITTFAVQPVSNNANFSSAGFQYSGQNSLAFTSTGACEVTVEIKYNHSFNR